MNLRQLRYFIKVVETGNITRAAEQLYVAQPALGLQIRQLERELGTPLVVRHSRGISPTAAGRVLFDRACTILQSVEEARKEVMSVGGQTRETIVFGLTPSIMLHVGSDVLVDARDNMPGIFLSLVEEMSFVLIEALERDELDLALAYEVGDRPGLVRTPIFEEDLLLVTAPGASTAAETIGFAQAIDRDLVLAGERDMVQRLVKAEAVRLSLPLRISFEAQSISAMKNLVARGVAASIMPYGTAVEEIRRGILVGQRIVQPAIKRTLYLVRPAMRAPFHHEDIVTGFVDRTIARLFAALGPLARKLEGGG